MTVKCEFCKGTGKEPGEDGCVWCFSTGTKEGQKLPAQPEGLVSSAAIAEVKADFEARKTQPAEQHQGEPVALPARDGSLGTAENDGYANGYRHGWNDYHAAVAKLGPLYTHADPGEVEQFPHGSPANKAVFMALESYTGTTTFEQACLQLAEETRALRAELRTQTLRADAAVGDANDAERKLAERDALLQQAKYVVEHARAIDKQAFGKGTQNVEHGLFRGLGVLLEQYDAALSASAEPSEPTCCVPTDEEKALLAAGDCTPEELWGGTRPTCPKCFKAEPSAPVERDERSAITLEQVLRAYDYAGSHPHQYLRGTTNWCAAVAHSLNEQANTAMERKP